MTHENDSKYDTLFVTDIRLPNHVFNTDNKLKDDYTMCYKCAITYPLPNKYIKIKVGELDCMYTKKGINTVFIPLEFAGESFEMCDVVLYDELGNVVETGATYISMYNTTRHNSNVVSMHQMMYYKVGVTVTVTSGIPRYYKLKGVVLQVDPCVVNRSFKDVKMCADEEYHVTIFKPHSIHLRPPHMRFKSECEIQIRLNEHVVDLPVQDDIPFPWYTNVCISSSEYPAVCTYIPVFTPLEVARVYNFNGVYFRTDKAILFEVERSDTLTPLEL
jgi:hypothetical protein